MRKGAALLARHAVKATRARSTSAVLHGVRMSVGGNVCRSAGQPSSGAPGHGGAGVLAASIAREMSGVFVTWVFIHSTSCLVLLGLLAAHGVSRWSSDGPGRNLA
mmetsp:Transcript_85338/g.228215  ORF Transcript_85338/g.228215 Transcript_85338/m.228215 type:complete len:105 (+) Transcript_85338:1287-1601(+)